MAEQIVCIGQAGGGRIKKSEAEMKKRLPNRRAVIDFCKEFFRDPCNADKRIDSYNSELIPRQPRYWTYSAVRHHNYNYPQRVKEHPQDYLSYNRNPQATLEGDE